ncbi:UDP-glucose:glycoprotein glucosyltransferases [Striga asiatica]|uniref:UDP-glucose:glycoprotein glucosyltransferases n=1 Tax=Striga asiatica TaxID=4170 RepID=A0A5A7NXY4_STRAF|nr:UDP-glucose:glycoprotein glucosyltransferases [Striga asiatica]
MGGANKDFDNSPTTDPEISEIDFLLHKSFRVASSFQNSNASPNLEDDSNFRHWESNLGFWLARSASARVKFKLKKLSIAFVDGYLYGLAGGHDKAEKEESGGEGQDGGDELEGEGHGGVPRAGQGFGGVDDGLRRRQRLVWLGDGGEYGERKYEEREW